MAMTQEELAVLNAQKAEIERLQANERRQNQYITQLEAQRGQAAQGTGTPQTAAPQAQTQAQNQNPMYQKWMEGQIKKEAVQNAVAKIRTVVSAEEFAAVEPDFLGFLEANMSINEANEAFIIDAYNLVYGRAKMRADHALNKLGKNSPAPAITPGTNAQQIAAVQRVVAGQPPVMTSSDVNAAGGTPVPTVQGPQTTRDAFQSLRDRLRSGEGNKFS